MSMLPLDRLPIARKRLADKPLALQGLLVADFTRFLAGPWCTQTLADFGSWYLMSLGVIAIAVMLFAPKGLWGLISARSGLHLFPVRRRLTGPKIEGG